MLPPKWCHIFGLLLVATGISSVAAYADVANPEVSEEHSPASLGCYSTIGAPEGETGLPSCQLEQGLDSAALDIQTAEGEFGTEGCNVYYGACSGADGCSYTEAEGFYSYSCIPYTYTWLMVCDGYYAYWGWYYC